MSGAYVSSTTLPRKEEATGRRRLGKLPLLLIVGVLLVAVAMGVRFSPWAREGQLKRASLPVLETWAAKSPNDPQVHYYLGTQLFNSGDAPGALTAFERACALNPRYAQAHIGVAAVRKEGGDMRGAHEAAQRALALEPKSSDAQFLVALTLYYQSPKAARLEFQKAVRLDPKRAEAWYWLGMSESALQQTADAIPAMERAVALDPGNALYQRELGRNLIDVNRFEPARAALEKAVAASPEDAQNLYYLAKSIHVSPRGKEDLPRAETLYRDCLKHLWGAEPINPVSICVTQTDLADILLQTSRVPEAVRLLEQAYQLNPKNLATLYKLGTASRRAGKEARAQALLARFDREDRIQTEVASLTERVKQDSKNPSLRLRMARAFAESGDLARAINQCQVALYMQPNLKEGEALLRSYERRLAAQQGASAKPGAGQLVDTHPPH